MMLSEKVAWLLVFVGGMLIANGCARPLNTAIVSANISAVALVEVRAAVVAHRAKAQRAAAKRVIGDRSRASVRAEQLDRARIVGLSYRKTFEAYETTRRLWVAVVAAIRVAQQQAEGGLEPNMLGIIAALSELAAAQKRLYTIAHDVTGMLGDGPPKAP